MYRRLLAVGLTASMTGCSLVGEAARTGWFDRYEVRDVTRGDTQTLTRYLAPPGYAFRPRFEITSKRLRFGVACAGEDITGQTPFSLAQGIRATYGCLTDSKLNGVFIKLRLSWQKTWFLVEEK